ncbi:hypothetical protein HOD08_03925 [bacterium]|nr:hypothetical protein [bacterium]
MTFCVAIFVPFLFFANVFSGSSSDFSREIPEKELNEIHECLYTCVEPLRGTDMDDIAQSLFKFLQQDRNPIISTGMIVILSLCILSYKCLDHANFNVAWNKLESCGLNKNVYAKKYFACLCKEMIPILGTLNVVDPEVRCCGPYCAQMRYSANIRETGWVSWVLCCLNGSPKMVPTELEWVDAAESLLRQLEKSKKELVQIRCYGTSGTQKENIEKLLDICMSWFSMEFKQLVCDGHKVTIS